MSGRLRPVSTRPEQTIALLEGCHLIEDFLDHLGVSLDAFRDEFRGSWMFGYIDALRMARVRTVFFCVSARVTAPLRFTHVPTGAKVCVLPTPRIYRAVRRRVLNPYADTVEKAVGNVRGVSRLFFAAQKEVAAYLATPLRLLARELRHEGCDAILCQGYEHARFDACVLLGRLMGLPVFATFQGGDMQYSHIERPLRPLTLRACAGLIIANQSETQRVRARYRIPDAKLARIFNPIDLTMWCATDRREGRAELGIPMSARVVVWHGRVLSHKGLDTLLYAWERVCRERSGRDLWLLLVGTGNDAEELRQHLAAMRLPGVLWIDRFVHNCDEIRRYLSAGDVYAFPSRHEGFPVAPIEAMACGLPVVAADAPGVADILEGGEASGGLLVPVGNAAAFALALGRILDNEAWGRELGERARRRAEDYFSLDAVGKQLRAFILRESLFARTDPQARV